MLDFQIEYRDFGYGSGFLSPGNNHFYLRIPKNASSFMNTWLYNSDWTSATVGRNNVDWSSVNNVIIILRDPIERWVSGISQYLKGCIIDTRISPKSVSVSDFLKKYNNVVEKLLFDQPNMFDDHVWPQYCFFENIFPELNRTYFYVNENLESNLRTKLNLKNVDSSGLDYHKSLDDEELKILTEFFSEKVYLPNGDSDLYQKLKDCYKKDYDLLDSVDLIK